LRALRAGYGCCGDEVELYQKQSAPFGSSLLASAAVVAAATAATAFLFHFVARAPEEFTLLVTCLSVPAATLLLFLGALIGASPDQHGYLNPVKAMATFSLAMTGVIVLDFILPTALCRLPMKGKIPAGNKAIVYVGSYREYVPADAIADAQEGDLVDVETTRLLGKVESMSLPGQGWMNVRSIADKASLAAAAALFFLPVGVMKFTPRKNDPARNMKAYLTLVVPSFILSLIALGLWIKLLLVHVAHMIDRM